MMRRVAARPSSRGEAVEPRHADVHQHEVRRQAPCRLCSATTKPQSRELRLGLTEKEDEFKFSGDVAPEATSEEDVSAGDSFVFSAMSPVSGRGGSRAPARWPTKASHL